VSRIDPECFPTVSASGNTVCTECFDDLDLAERIEGYETPGECSYCGTDREFVAPFDEIAEFIAKRMSTFYGRAVDQLPYNGREGGYLARHEDTYDCLFESIGLELSCENEDALRDDLVGEIGDDLWCDFDWLALEIDQSLLSSWDEFCAATKSSRRFFFHNIGQAQSYHPDERSVIEFLHEVTALIEGMGLVQMIPAGYPLFRARPHDGDAWAEPCDLGPPPAAVALQSNRMNPPGIPMFYGAETANLAALEVRATQATIGEFRTLREIRIINLADLPPIPGFFSEASREERQGLSFLHRLTRIMAAPVPQNDRVNVDYIPTQILTEFFRDYGFDGGQLDGVRYVTSLNTQGANAVLFATQDNLVTDKEPESAARWIELVATQEYLTPEQSSD
jgi:hypothetical protein